MRRFAETALYRVRDIQPGPCLNLLRSCSDQPGRHP